MRAFQFHAEPLQAEWLDAYGHLNEAYYLLPFSNASWIMQTHFGIGTDYFKRSGCALYTVETHLRYLKEVRAPAQLAIETLMLGSDAKRIWFAHLMTVDDQLRATGEFMALHYDTRKNCTAAMPEHVQAALKKAQTADPPEWVRRRIGLDKN